MEPSKTSQARCERHHNTFTPSLHLVPLVPAVFFLDLFLEMIREKRGGRGGDLVTIDFVGGGLALLTFELSSFRD